MFAVASSGKAYTDAAGPYKVASVKYEWRDTARDREVPVKIYYPADCNTPCPVIIFSHGLGGSRDGYEYLGRHWASWAMSWCMFSIKVAIAMLSKTPAVTSWPQ